MRAFVVPGNVSPFGPVRPGLEVPQGLSGAQFDRISSRVRDAADSMGLGGDILRQRGQGTFLDVIGHQYIGMNQAFGIDGGLVWQRQSYLGSVMRKNKNKKDVIELINFLKVFDANYVNDEDCAKIKGIDANTLGGVDLAARRLLLPEFSTYIPPARERLLNIFRSCIADQEEDFSTVFDQISLVFDDEIVDRRMFMAALLEEVESWSL